MAINYITPSGGGTLSPPILNGIEQINSSTSLAISASNFSINTTGVTQLFLDDTEFNCTNASFGGTNTFQVNGYNTLIISINDTASLSSPTTVITGINLLQFNSNAEIYFDNRIKINGFTTAQILAFVSPAVGTMVFNNTLNQMFWYQVSPITGLVLGWYNSTGNIKL